MKLIKKKDKFYIEHKNKLTEVGTKDTEQNIITALSKIERKINNAGFNIKQLKEKFKTVTQMANINLKLEILTEWHKAVKKDGKWINTPTEEEFVKADRNRLKEVLVTDGTGTLVFTLWGNECIIKEGDKVELKKGFAKRKFDNRIHLSSGKLGYIRVIDDEMQEM